MEQLRRSYLTLPLPGSPAVANGQATFLAGHPMRITSIQLGLSDVGTGAGGTTAVVKLNGVAITTDAPLTLTVAGAVKAVKVGVSPTLAPSYPGGVRVAAGDTITVDLTAVPGTTSPKAVTVTLGVVQIDV